MLAREPMSAEDALSLFIVEARARCAVFLTGVSQALAAEADDLVVAGDEGGQIRLVNLLADVLDAIEYLSGTDV
jgi:hypothetical protein